MNFKKSLSRFYLRHPNALVFWFLFFALYFPIVSFLLVSLSIVIIIFWPFQSYDVQLPVIDSEKVTIISHGLKDDNKTWAKELKTVLHNREPNTKVLAIDWGASANNAFTCAVNGRRIGHQIANELLDNDAVSSVRLIGHSCGAFVNYGICEGIRERNTSINVEAVYLDPVAVYGGIFWNFGYQYFGDCADKSTTYFDTEDNVPGSNKAPIHSQGVDVTAYKTQYGYQGKAHLWPIFYYLEMNKEK